MSSPRVRMQMTIGLGLALAAGCGGTAPEVADAIIVAAPDGSTTSSGAPAPSGTTPPAGTTDAGTAGDPPAATPASAVATAPATKAEGWGTLKGRVILTGTAPTFAPLVPKGGDANTKDPAVCAKEAIPNEKLIVDPETKGVKLALVYIPKPTAVNEEAKSAALAADVVFDQKDCVFRPHVLGVMTGSKIMLQSSDPVGHNVNSKVENNQLNSSVTAGPARALEIKAPARRPGLVVCDIHPWMTAYWLVLDNPYFAVTDEKGNFEIKNAPAGTQKVVVWQEGVTFVTPTSGQDVNIAANGETTQEFKIDAGKIKK